MCYHKIRIWIKNNENIMSVEKIIPGLILIGLGLIFFFNSQQIGKGAFKFYQKLYSEKNLPIMFKICGVLLVVGGLVLMFVK